VYIVQVNIQVKHGALEAFIQASKENAKSSLQEPGVVRFDIYQQEQDPAFFEFIEIYQTQEDALKHRETVHFQHWTDIAEPMMVQPRTRTIFKNISPSDFDW
jgi:(4S)-4-hydroxy-5-phosphonooxypentane-2,3-dione isomerase